MSQININRIKAAGNSAKLIYQSLIAQIIVGSVWGVLLKNPQWFISSYDIEDSLNNLVNYYQIINVGMGIVEIIIFLIIVISIRSIAFNLIKADLPLNVEGYNSENKKPIIKANGGIIVYEDNGHGMVMSNELGKMNWDEAKQICSQLNTEGYDDWYLPNEDELKAIYQNLSSKRIDGLSNKYYWSSTESKSDKVYVIDFKTGGKETGHKSTAHHVRAVRTF